MLMLASSTEQVKASDTNKTTYTLLAIPKLETLCTQALQDAGVYAALQIQSFPLDLIPLERDLLSLEQPDAFKSIFEVCHFPLPNLRLEIHRTEIILPFTPSERPS